MSQRASAFYAAVSRVSRDAGYEVVNAPVLSSALRRRPEYRGRYLPDHCVRFLGTRRLHLPPTY